MSASKKLQQRYLEMLLSGELVYEDNPVDVYIPEFVKQEVANDLSKLEEEAYPQLCLPNWGMDSDNTIETKEFRAAYKKFQSIQNSALVKALE